MRVCNSELPGQQGTDLQRHSLTRVYWAAGAELEYLVMQSFRKRAPQRQCRSHQHRPGLEAVVLPGGVEIRLGVLLAGVLLGLLLHQLLGDVADVSSVQTAAACSVPISNATRAASSPAGHPRLMMQEGRAQAGPTSPLQALTGQSRRPVRWARAACRRGGRRR